MSVRSAVHLTGTAASGSPSTWRCGQGGAVMIGERFAGTHESLGELWFASNGRPCTES